MTISFFHDQYQTEPSDEPAIGQDAPTMTSSKTKSGEENESFLPAGQEYENKSYSSIASGTSGLSGSESTTAEKRQHLEDTTT